MGFIFYFPFSLDFCFMNIGVLHACLSVQHVHVQHVQQWGCLQHPEESTKSPILELKNHHIYTRNLPLGEQLVLLTIDFSLLPLYFHVYTSFKIKYSSRIVNIWRLLVQCLDFQLSICIRSLTFCTVHHLSQSAHVEEQVIAHMQPFSDLISLHPVAICKTPIRMIRRWYCHVLPKLTFTKKANSFKVFIQRQSSF